MCVPYSEPLARHVRSDLKFGRFTRTSKSAWLRDLYICPLERVARAPYEITAVLRKTFAL